MIVGCHVWTTALRIASCASAPSVEHAVPIALRNPGFEEPVRRDLNCASGWACSAHAYPDSFRYFHDEAHPASGARSFCLEPVGHEPWAAVSQVTFNVDSIRGRHVRFMAAVRLDKVTGEGAGPVVIVQGGSGQVIAHAESYSTGTQTWHDVAVDLDVPRAAALIEVGLALTGRGTACIDDARLEVTGPARGPV